MSGIGSSDVIYGFPCQFVILPIFSKWNLAFRDFVQCVFSIVSKVQMSRIHTVFHVFLRTVVQNIKSLGNLAVVKQPRSSVGRNPVARSKLVYRTIPVGVDTPNPQPTRFGLFHLCPKSLREGLGKSLRSKVINRNLDHSQFVNAARVTGPAAFYFYQFAMKPST